VTITTEKAKYPKSLVTIIIKIQKDSNSEFNTGAHVFLEKGIDGTWYRGPMKADSFTEEGIVYFIHGDCYKRLEICANPRSISSYY
jgi:hypothetical protein